MYRYVYKYKAHRIEKHTRMMEPNLQIQKDDNRCLQMCRKVTTRKEKESNQKWKSEIRFSKHGFLTY